VEECDETQFWLEYLIRIGLLTEIETRELKSEVDELVRLFTSIKKKMKEKLKVG
jgi:four helix bundle protein